MYYMGTRPSSEGVHHNRHHLVREREGDLKRHAGERNEERQLDVRTGPQMELISNVTALSD